MKLKRFNEFNEDIIKMVALFDDDGNIIKKEGYSEKGVGIFDNSGNEYPAGINYKGKVYASSVDSNDNVLTLSGKNIIDGLKIGKIYKPTYEKKNVHIQKDYANNKLPNKLSKPKIDKFEDQGWFLYHKDILNTHAIPPPEEGVYDVKSDFGYKVRTDVAEFKDGKFKKSKEYGLPDDQITHWKMKESQNKDYKYNKKTGKFTKIKNK
ncbi:MAG: hypothetical protein ACOCVF_03835 [bacterium]